MRQTYKLNPGRIARGLVFLIVGALVFVLWLPFGLIFWLVVLNLFALLTAISIFKYTEAGDLRCTHCQFYEGMTGITGTCRLTRKVAWSGSKICKAFVLR